jgi:chemotaxis-related protein WspB
VLFVLFQLGKERYALAASRVVEVAPLLALKRLPQAPKGVAGIFNYRGRPVPALDLSELALGVPSSERLSTRIIVVNYQSADGLLHLLGLIAEHATEMLRKDPKDFVEPGLKIDAAPYLGPVLIDSQGAIQWLDTQQILSESTRDLLFANSVEPAVSRAAGTPDNSPS